MPLGVPLGSTVTCPLTESALSRITVAVSAAPFWTVLLPDVISAATLELPASKSFRPAPVKKLVPVTLAKKLAVVPALTRNSLPLFMVTGL